MRQFTIRREAAAWIIAVILAAVSAPPALSAAKDSTTLAGGQTAVGWTPTQWIAAPPEIAPIKAPFAMPRLQRPVFRDQTFPITRYGAVGDGRTKNTEAFRKAIAACHQAGGGTVLVPAGKWFTGAIHLKSNVNLHLEPEAEIHFSDDPNDYLPVVFTRWAGLELMNYSPLIYAYGCENIAITGPGKLFGHGKRWWEWVKQEARAQTARRIYEQQVLKNLPPEQRICGTPEAALRPQFLNPVRCTNVLFEGFTVSGGGPFWTFDITYCDHIIVRGLTINTTGGPNTDGVNFNSSRNGLFEYCEINSGDDCCALKSGLNEDGWRVGRPTENIVIRHVRGLTSSTGGVVCGSEMSGGVRNIYVCDCEFSGNQRALWIKSNPSRGGTVENIWYENIRLRNVRDALFIQSDYGAYVASQGDTAFPTFRNIFYENITVEGAQVPISLSSIYKPIEAVTLENVTITGAKSGMRFRQIKGLTLKNVTCNGAISIQNCTDVVRSNLVAGAAPAGSSRHPSRAAPMRPPALLGYDPSAQIRFRTAPEAEAKRQELITFIWADGLPTNALPAVRTNIGPVVFSGDLSGLNGALAGSVDQLDANVAPYSFRGISYLVHPLAVSTNNRRLVILNSGHRTGVTFNYGVNDAANCLLSNGFCVLMTDMPLVGFNSNRTVVLPNGGGTATISKRGTAGHNEMFSKLTPPVLPDGTIFRFFLEPMVQGLNYFLHVTPGAVDVAYVGLSGGGWTGHMLAALDTRIKRSFPVAGAYPLYIRQVVRTPDDTEQTYAPLYLEIATKNTNGIPDTAAGVASWLEIYALGGYGPGRQQIQILNLYDTCCFSGDAFTTYTNFVSTVVRNLGEGEWSFYSDSSHSNHIISPEVLNRVIMPRLAGNAGAAGEHGAKAAQHEALMSLTPEEWEKQANLPDQIAPIIAPFPMPQLKRPVFPDRAFNIADFGAVGDGTTKNTTAIAAAIAACDNAGGGKVLVPAGQWLTGAIHLKSNVNLHMQEGAELHFSDDPQDYLLVVFTRWAGFEVMNYSPLIYANGCENIAITGPGKLFGHGRGWWDWNKRLDEKNKVGARLEDQAVKGIPPQERVYGSPAVGLRPQFISPINCRNVLLEGFTIAEPGPFWTIQFIYCENVIARGLAIHTKGGPNTDGIDLDSTRYALVEHCLLDVGDDAVCLKSGINEDGRRVGKPTENVVVRNITALSCHGGIVIGSETSGGVRNVLVYDCFYDGSQCGIRLKSNAARGGVVENLFYRNITMRNIGTEAIRLESNYSAWGQARTATNRPTFRNLHLKDITCEGAGRAASIQGTSHQSVEGFSMENVSIKAKAGMKFDWVSGLKLVKVTSTPAAGESVSFRNCKDVVEE